jgi:hypothetical protein
MTSLTQIPEEIHYACRWWKEQIGASDYVAPSMADRFERSLILHVWEKLDGHWFPGNTTRAQAYRSIALERYAAPDRELLKAAADAGVDNILACLPSYIESLVMWIDPGEVAVKTHYTYSHKADEEVVFSSKSNGSPHRKFRQPTLRHPVPARASSPPLGSRTPSPPLARTPSPPLVTIQPPSSQFSSRTPLLTSPKILSHNANLAKQQDVNSVNIPFQQTASYPCHWQSVETQPDTTGFYGQGHQQFWVQADERVTLSA